MTDPLSLEIARLEKLLRSVLRAWGSGQWCETSPAMKKAKAYLREADQRRKELKNG